MIQFNAYVYDSLSDQYVAIQRICQGTTIHDTIDRTLDSATLIIDSSLDNAYSVWQSIRIEIPQEFDRKYLIADVNKTSNNAALDTYPYRYTLTLIEPTKYLEKVICPNIPFTNKYLTLKQQIERLLGNVEVRLFGQTSRFSLSSSLINFLGSTPGEDFVFGRQRTLRESLDSMLAVKNARCVVHEITNFNNIVIDYFDETFINNQIEMAQRLKHEEVHNIEYLGSEIEAYGDNAFSGNREAIYHPSPNGYASIKTSEPTLTTENGEIVTSHPIEKIDEFLINGIYLTVVEEYLDEYSTLQQDARQILTNIDIAGQIVTQEIYEILPTVGRSVAVSSDGSLHQENTIIYLRGEKRFKDGMQHPKDMFFKAQNMQSAVEQASYNVIYLNQAEWKAKFNPIHSGGVITSVYYEAYAYSPLTFRYRIKYVPYIDGHTKLSKSTYNEVKSVIISQQSDKIIDLNRYGNNLYGQINRLGNKEITINTNHDDIAEVFERGDITQDGYVITTRDIATYNNFIKAHYELSQDYNQLSQKIGIDRREKLYHIPLDNVVTDLLIKKKVFLTSANVADYSDLIAEYIKTFGNSGKKPITNVIVRTSLDNSMGTNLANLSSGSISSFESNGIISYLFEMPIIRYAMANAIHFNFKFDDNYSAGTSSTVKIIGGQKQVQNGYVNQIGEAYQFWIRMFNDSLAERSQAYDDVKLYPRVNPSYYNNVVFPINDTVVHVKDALEFIQCTAMIEAVTNEHNIIIGSALAKYNALINDANNNIQLYVSTTDKYRIIENTKPIGILETNQLVTIAGNSIIVDGDTIMTNVSNIQSWGITINGELAIGVNKVGTSTISIQIRFYSS